MEQEMEKRKRASSTASSEANTIRDEDNWVHDSSVDHKGRVPLRASTGVWKASLFIISKSTLCCVFCYVSVCIGSVCMNRFYACLWEPTVHLNMVFYGCTTFLWSLNFIWPLVIQIKDDTMVGFYPMWYKSFKIYSCRIWVVGHQWNSFSIRFDPRMDRFYVHHR